MKIKNVSSSAAALSVLLLCPLVGCANDPMHVYQSVANRSWDTGGPAAQPGARSSASNRRESEVMKRSAREEGTKRGTLVLPVERID